VNVKAAAKPNKTMAATSAAALALGSSARHGNAQRVYLCAEINHTQGAAEYALLSYLTLAVRAQKELPHSRIEVILPMITWNRYNAFSGAFYTQSSLRALARAHGFAFLWDAQGNHQAFSKKVYTYCSRAHFDVRVGVVVTSNLPSEVAPAMAAPNFSAARQQVGGLTSFHESVWEYLRSALQRSLAARPALRVCFTLHQMWLGPLGHASAIYPAEAAQVVRALDFSGGPALGHHQLKVKRASPPPPPPLTPSSPSLSSSECSYAFFGSPYGFSKKSKKNAKDDSWECASALFLHQAQVTINLTRAAGLACAIVNVLTQPPQAVSSVPAIFQSFDPGFGIATVKKNSGVHLGDMEGHDPNDSASQNLKERLSAAHAPLFISTSGTHWGDGVLYKRSALGLRSAIMADDRDAPLMRSLQMPVPPDVFVCERRGAIDCARDCAFHRSVCANRTLYGAAGQDFGDALMFAIPHGGVRRIARGEAADGDFIGAPLGRATAEEKTLTRARADHFSPPPPTMPPTSAALADEPPNVPCSMCAQPAPQA
jgi:hypothetical protein